MRVNEFINVDGGIIIMYIYWYTLLFNQPLEKKNFNRISADFVNA